jgi:hypothetical protein
MRFWQAGKTDKNDVEKVFILINFILKKNMTQMYEYINDF